MQVDHNVILRCLVSATDVLKCDEWPWKPVKLHNTRVIKENVSLFSSESTIICQNEVTDVCVQGHVRVCVFGQFSFQVSVSRE